MDVTFLGGAEEVGASCTVLDAAPGVRYMIDCGQRLGAGQGSELPDFSLLEKGPPIRAVLLTHSHIDHIGALPALEPYLTRDCLIYGTAPTLDLARVMLDDSRRSSQLYRQGDGQLPLFSPICVGKVFDRFTPVRWGQIVKLAGGGKARWFPSGHILGAGMIEIVHGDENVLFSGDLSIADQASVAGAFVPSIEPQMLIIESTYGNRLHTHRPQQEERILLRVRECIGRGGCVLFPTFALGRAQEVLLLLGRGMRDGQLPEVPVFADGLVREIARVYSRHAEDMSSGCRRLREQGLDPIFPDDLPIRPVRDQGERELIAKKAPCIMVASGGMLQGGASQFYARQWIGEEKNLICITGYQDEESPGQALLRLSALPVDEKRYFMLGGVQTEVRCHVENYSLSAHADNGELVALVSKLHPKLVLPVHGDDDAREALARGLRHATGAVVTLPTQGETYGVSPKKKAPTSQHARLNPLALWPPWDPYSPRELDLERIYRWLSTLKPALRWVTVEEVATLWKSPDSPNDAALDAVRSAVAAQEHPYFVADLRRPHLLYLTSPENLQPHPVRTPIDQATETISAEFPPESGLLRIGFFPAEGAVELTFQYPAAARRHYQVRLQALTRRIGWRPEIAGRTDAAGFGPLLQAWLNLPSEPTLDVDHGAERVKAKLAAPTQGDFHDDLDDVAKRFAMRTGYELEIESDDEGSMSSASNA